jgi:hypothetical protein
MEVFDDMADCNAIVTPPEGTLKFRHNFADVNKDMESFLMEANALQPCKPDVRMSKRSKSVLLRKPITRKMIKADKIIIDNKRGKSVTPMRFRRNKFVLNL